MGNEKENQIRLEVYYTSAAPISTFWLEQDDEHFAWLADSLPVVPRGDHYCLYLNSPREFRQARRMFPVIGHTNRHLRFRGFLRKKATKRQPTPSPEISWQPSVQEAAPAISLTGTSGFSWRQIVSLFKLSLSRF
ncbi:hypothetical protein [Sabulibacter ruber]|uniref:hypothetical protein n=1 Tax=Sabulibacter ruber TaxID=2811901 RepID=UPI001A96C476|nr:hypothetical protein [Sabulibacter ruber]